MINGMDIEPDALLDMNENNMVYGAKEPETYKECVLRAIEKCRVEMSKELTKGKTIFIEKNGVSIPVVIPDQRKVVESCIKSLYNLLLFTFDQEAIDLFKQIKKDINGLDKKYLESYIKKEVYVPNRRFAQNNNQIPAESPLGNAFIQEKEDERMELYEEMYQELLLLYKRKRELSNKRIASNDAPVDWDKVKEELEQDGSS